MNIASTRVMENAAAKAELAQALIETCSIYARVLASNGRGGQTETYPVSASSACWPERMDDGTEDEYAGLLKGRAGFFVHLPAGTTCPLSARIVVLGNTLEVVSVGYPTGGEPIRKVICALIS